RRPGYRRATPTASTTSATTRPARCSRSTSTATCRRSPTATGASGCRPGTPTDCGHTSRSGSGSTPTTDREPAPRSGESAGNRRAGRAQLSGLGFERVLPEGAGDVPSAVAELEADLLQLQGLLQVSCDVVSGSHLASQQSDAQSSR